MYVGRARAATGACEPTSPKLLVWMEMNLACGSERVWQNFQPIRR